MADILSQDDLDALWGQTPGDESQGQNGAKGEAPTSAGGLSQADLDALMGGPSDGKTVDKKADASPIGLSQADLNALWGLAADDPGPEAAGPKAAPNTEPAAPIGENLSQDDIEKLLAEFGK